MDIMQILEKNTDKMNFLKGLIRLSKCDEVVAKEEKEFFVAAALQMGLTENDIRKLDECWNMEEKIEISFSSKKAAYFFIREGMQLCAVDKHYVEEEKEEIFNIADELELNKESVMKLQQWVEEGMRWQEKGNELLEEIIVNAG